MSKYDLLSTEDGASARAAGWQLVVVIDQKTLRSSAQILPLEFSKQVPSCRAALQRVVSAAQLVDGGLERRALKAMLAFNTKGKKQ